MACPNVPICHPQCVNDSWVILTVSTQPDAARLVHILYHKQKPTHTCFEAQMSHITSFTTTIVSLLTNARMNPWPVTTGVRWVRLCVFFSVGACAGLTPALRADWLLIPWCVFRLCSHSYCIYGCVSVHLTNHTHSHSLCLCLPSSHFQNSTLQLSYCHFILLPLSSKASPSSNLRCSIHVCLRVPVRKWHSSVLTALWNCMWWAATGRDPVMFFLLSIPCCTTTSPLLTVISAHWSRNKCFSQSGA